METKVVCLLSVLACVLVTSVSRAAPVSDSRHPDALDVASDMAHALDLVLATLRSQPPTEALRSQPSTDANNTDSSAPSDDGDDGSQNVGDVMAARGRRTVPRSSAAARGEGRNYRGRHRAPIYRDWRNQGSSVTPSGQGREMSPY